MVIGLLGTMPFALLGGGQRVLLLRETLLTGVIGLACLLSLPLPKPAGFYFSRQLITANDKAKQPGYSRLWANRRFRRTVRQLTAFWGLVLLGEFALQVVMVLTLPVAVVLATGTIVVALPRIAALTVTFIVGRRVSARIRNETAATSQANDPPPPAHEPNQNDLNLGGGRLSGRAWGMLLVLCGALFLDALDVSMITVALPSIRIDLSMSTSALQWVVSGYVLGYGGFLLLGGRAADLLGRRRMFLISLAVFLIASALGGLAADQSLLIGTRFVKGVSAAFTAPAGLSIITTSFPEGPVRNKALAFYTATGATGFSLGLVAGGLLTQISWRWVFFFPAPIALITLLAAIRLVPGDRVLARSSRTFDVAGAVILTAAMLLLVFTIVEAAGAGWASARTLGSLAVAGAMLAGFLATERRTDSPLVRLGILRSSSLVRANLAAMALFGAWVGFLFIATLYMQQLRGWSALQTGLAIAPSGLVVALLAPRIAPLVARFGTTRLILAGLASAAGAYGLFLPIGLDSGYTAAILPTVLLGGLGFALAFGPLNIAATNGIAAPEQGLASGLVNTSFQFGGALALAVVTAVNGANANRGESPQALLHGFHAATVVSLSVAVVGLAVTALRRRPPRTPAPQHA